MGDEMGSISAMAGYPLPSVPQRTPRIESEHFEVGQKPVEAGNKAIGPAAVELVGEGGIHRGHGERRKRIREAQGKISEGVELANDIWHCER